MKFKQIKNLNAAICQECNCLEDCRQDLNAGKTILKAEHTKFREMDIEERLNKGSCIVC